MVNVIILSVLPLHTRFAIVEPIVTMRVSLTSSDYFQFSSNSTRGHTYKLYISQNSCNIRKNFVL